MSDATSFTEELDSQLDHLNTLRKAAAEARKRRQEILRAAQETPEYVEADNITNDTDAMITKAEATIREMSLALWEQSAELPERVTVKNFPVVTIHDDKKAREWCFTNLRKALKMDSKVFEAEVKDKNSEVPTEIAEVKIVPKAQIATNLDKS